jgi:fatty acid desaturase
MPATAAPRFVLGVSLTMQSPSAVGSASPAVTPNAYREYLKAAGFSKDELKTIYAFNDRRAVLDFLGALTTTAAVPWLYWIYPSWITVVVCVLLSIHNFNALTQVGHASGHASFLSDTRWNAIVGEIACALRGFSRAGFALSHQMHHAFLNEEDDGDILFGRPDEPTRKLLLMCLQDLMLVTAFKRLLQYMQTDRKTYDQRPWDPWEKITIRFFVDRLGMMVPIAAAQMVLLGYYWIVIGPQYYFFFYLLPLATLYPAQIRLRSASEHSFEAGYDVASRGRWLSVVRMRAFSNGSSSARSAVITISSITCFRPRPTTICPSSGRSWSARASKFLWVPDISAILRNAGAKNANSHWRLEDGCRDGPSDWNLRVNGGC